RIGPDLREAYWRPGNARSFQTQVEELTREPLGADALARRVSRSVEQAMSEAHRAVARERTLPVRSGAIDLGCRIRIVHGCEEIASGDADEFESVARQFERWVDARGDVKR